MASGKDGSSSEISVLQLVLTEQRESRKEMTEQFTTVNKTLGGMLERLSVGDERLKGHSDFINEARSVIAAHKSGDCPALSRRDSPQDATTIRKRKHPSWWVLALAGGALTLAGERGFSAAIRALSDQPQQATAQHGAP
jgi:hypothetical protein